MRFSTLCTLAAAAVLVSACQNPDGSVNYANSALLGAGVGAATGLVAAGVSDNNRYYGNGYYHGGGYYAPPPPPPRYYGGGGYYAPRGYYYR